MIQTCFQPSANGAILFDGALVQQADDSWFEPGHWRAGNSVIGEASGRGQVWYVRAPFGDCVLRHYRRGGLVARLLFDRYLWTGAEQTRGFREFRLMTKLHAIGLPVPAPIAARYVRRGAYYKADLITRRLPAVETLAQRLATGRFDAALATAVGACIAAFHAHGVMHADLNAHNILVDNSKIWLVDFDRGEVRSPAAAWHAANLARLKRSLLKLGAAKSGRAPFEDYLWRVLTNSYERELNRLALERMQEAPVVEPPRSGA